MKQPNESHPYSKGDAVDYTWSARFSIDPPEPFEEAVFDKLGGLVREFEDPEWPISGAVLGNMRHIDRKTIVLGLDPSRNFGTPSIGRCEEIAGHISERYRWLRLPENPAAMRIILGRRVGYENDSRSFSMQAVRDITVARGCGSLALTEADLFSLRYVDGLRRYHEPGVIIEGSVDNLEGALSVAADMGQERLVVETTDVSTQVYFHDKAQA